MSLNAMRKNPVLEQNVICEEKKNISAGKARTDMVAIKVLPVLKINDNYWSNQFYFIIFVHDFL